MKNLGGVSFVEQFRRFNLIILVTAGEFKKTSTNNHVKTSL